MSNGAIRTECRRMSPPLRNTVLVLHLLMGIGWMGIDIALFVLLMTARTTNDATLAASAFNSIHLIVPVTVPPLSFGMLVTGLILGLGTRWGLIRYWWVLVKLMLALIMTVLVYIGLLPVVNNIPILSATAGNAEALRAGLGSLPTTLMFPPIVSFLLLGIATILSIFKPWRLTPWSRDSNTGPS